MYKVTDLVQGKTKEPVGSMVHMVIENVTGEVSKMQKPIEPLIEELLNPNLHAKVLIDNWNPLRAVCDAQVERGVKLCGHQYKVDEGIGLGTIGVEDCMLLYLMIANYQPKCILEIGTWYGTSTVAMAAAASLYSDDFEIITYDVSKAYNPDNPYTDHITCHNRHSAEINFKEIKPDFIFIDAVIDPVTASHLNKYIQDGVVLVTHDWFPPEMQKVRKEKGAPAFYRIDRKGEFEHLVPSHPEISGYCHGINTCCAVMRSK